MSILTRKANRASSTVLSQHVDREHWVDGTSYVIRVLRSSELSPALQRAIWDLFRENMEGLYKSTEVFTWDPVEKRAELFDRTSRFVLVTEQGFASSLVAYSMFRFDVEEDMSGRDEDVLYCYELQVHKEQRGHGLGKFLVKSLETLGRQWAMKKVMLTVLNANVGAVRFYQREGFVVDVISPEDDDYRILSKALCK